MKPLRVGIATYGLARYSRAMAFAPNITDIACDLRDHGWTDGDYRANQATGEAVCEWTRGNRKIWALVDMTTNDVLAGTAVSEVLGYGYFGDREK